ncbi:MAG TPA: hypothetical protein P5567_08965 [Kiritimatiellia bacterium]|nr:hypothetical protein [Kiritimatiellia bacterium]HRZ12572.1 hypothetical protein [Kiritimatiellia bacterium]HSA17650.1 hypothetical protein [Kiritimatiellia bacterium]
MKGSPAVREFLSRLYSLVPARRRWPAAFWKWYAFYEDAETWPVERMEAYQLERIRRLLSSARAGSPFYAEKLKDVRPDDIRSLADFSAAVPATTRRELRENMDRWPCRDRAAKAERGCTSGTTGMALQFLHPPGDRWREWASICHQWKRVGYDPAHSVRATFRGLTLDPAGVDRRPHSNTVRFAILGFDRARLERYAAEIRRCRAEFFHGYPSALSLLASTIRHEALDFPQPRAILLASEVVYDWQLAAIREAFPDARLFAHYGCAERAILAGWCERRPAYHVLSPYGFLEVSPDTGEVMATNLHNDVSPFIRYRMTDTVRGVSADACPDCRRPYRPLVEELVGRQEDYVYSPARGWIGPAIITYPFKGLKAIRETRIVQTAPGELVLQFTSAPGAATEDLRREQEHLRHGMHKLLGEEMRVSFEACRDLERDRSGKFKWIVSRLPPPGDHPDGRRGSRPCPS